MDRLIIPPKALRGTNSLRHFKEFAREHLPSELGKVLQNDREWREFHGDFKKYSGGNGMRRNELVGLIRGLKKDDGGQISYAEARKIEKGFRRSVESGELPDGGKNEDYFPDRI